MYETRPMKRIFCFEKIKMLPNIGLNIKISKTKIQSFIEPEPWKWYYNLENEKVVVHNDIYSHTESYKHLNRNQMKSRKEKCSRHNIGVPEPWWLQYGIVDATIPQGRNSRGTQRWRCFLGCSHPLPMAGSMFPGTPLELELLCHTRWEWCNLFISWGSCGHATPLGISR